MKTTISLSFILLVLLSGCYTYRETTSSDPIVQDSTKTLKSDVLSASLTTTPTATDKIVQIKVTKTVTYTYKTLVNQVKISDKNTSTKAGGWASAVMGGIIFTTYKVNDKKDPADQFIQDKSIQGIMKGVGIGSMIGGVALIALPREWKNKSIVPGDPIEKQEIVPAANTPVEILSYNNEKHTFTTDENGNINLTLGQDFVYEGLKYGEDVPLSISSNGTPIDGELALHSADWLEAPEVAEVTYRGGGDPLKGLNVSKGNQPMVIGTYYAIVIGIDDYSGEWPKLSNAVNDAKAVANLLQSKYKIDKLISFYNKEATRKKIIDEFEWLVANIKPEDNLFIYYSGHGEFKKELNKGYWVPVDAKTTSTSNFISNNDLQTFLGGIKSKHTLLVSDACFSGDIFRGNTVSVPFENSEKYFNEVHSLISRQAISSGGIEPVMDGGKDGHSVFAYYFLKALQNNDAKYFDASQIYEKIKIPVINNSEQTPKFQSVKNTGDEGGQFIFIKNK